MDRRKLSSLDEYIIAISEPPEFASKRIQFYNNLRHFYRKKWGCPLKIPSIQGVEVDLYKLYEAVVSFGGFQKVSNFERWKEVLREISIDEDIQMAEYGIKMIYIRFLSKFEQNELGSEIDEHESDLLGSRMRIKNFAFAANMEAPVSVPKNYNLYENNGPEYRKIVKSLLSGLPNEVDFAINICTLLSHPGPYLLRLIDCPQLATILVAHCGIFADDETSLSDLFFNSWITQSKHDFSTFWQNSGIIENDILALLPHSNSTKTKNILNDFSNNHCFTDERLDLKEVTSWRIFQILSILRNLSFEECNKVSMAENLPLLKFLLVCAYSKYQVLINNAFDTLSNIASEIDLNTIGSVFENYLLLKMLFRGLFSNDKFQVLRSLEILTGLCYCKNNESLICDFVNEKVLSRLFTLITAKDIMLCIFSLETIYQMSEMGRSTCEVLSRYEHNIDVLVDLATLDATAFKGSGLAGIKVVEIHGITGQLQPYHPPSKNTSQMNTPITNGSLSFNKSTYSSPVQSIPSTNRTIYLNSVPTTTTTAINVKPIQTSNSYSQLLHYQSYVPPPPSPLTTTSVRPSLAATPVPIASNNSAIKTATFSSAVMNASPSKFKGNSTKKFVSSRNLKNLSTALNISITQPPPQAVQDVVDSIGSNFNNGESRLEQLTKQWINNHCLLESDSIANRGDMYACYVDYIRTEHDQQNNRILACSIQMFINLLKSIFPSITITHSPGSSIHAVEGLRFIKEGKTDGLKKMGTFSNVVSQHPLVQKMLSSPSILVTGTNEISNHSLNGNLMLDNLNNTNSTPTTSNFCNGTNFLGKEMNIENENQLLIKNSYDYDGGSLLCNGINNEGKTFIDNTVNNIKSNNNISSFSEHIKNVNGNGTLINNKDIVETNKNDTQGIKPNNNILAIDEKKHEFYNIEYNQKINGGDIFKSKNEELPYDRIIMPAGVDASMPISKFLENDFETKNHLNGLYTSKSKKRLNSSNGLLKGLNKRSRNSSIRNTLNNFDPQMNQNKITNGVVSSTYNYIINNNSIVSSPQIHYDMSVPSTSNVQINDYMCEWDGCGKFFSSVDSILFHNTNDHLHKFDKSASINGADISKKFTEYLFLCRWPACDLTPRSKWSMVTHLQDHHCVESLLQNARVKRIEMGYLNYLSYIKQRIEPLKDLEVYQAQYQQTLAQHSGYSRFAAMDAIKRQACSSMPRDITDESEGPVTKNMRLTSCLALRNIAKHSVEGRRKIRKYENHLCYMAFSKMESSAALAQCLGELATNSIISDQISVLPSFLQQSNEMDIKIHTNKNIIAKNEI